MRELVYMVATSIDGQIAGAGGDISAFPNQGDHIDALCAEWPETLPGPFLTAVGITPKLEKFDTVIMGWNTYRLGLDAGLTSPYPHLRQWVCSRQHRAPDPEVQTHAADPLILARELKAMQGRPIWLCGGGQLAAALWSEIDRIILKVNPIALGQGIPLFGAQTSDSLVGSLFSLSWSRSFKSGVVMNEYARQSS